MARLIEDLRKLNKVELLEKKGTAIAEYRKVKFNLKSGEITAENINSARSLKDEISKISTVLKELELIKQEDKEDENKAN